LNRQNKKENVAALHRETIMSAAEKLFLEKGVSATTIDDISKASEYSRRTIYAYFESKEAILYHIIVKGLSALKENICAAIESSTDFMKQYFAICSAMKEYDMSSPQSFESVNQANIKNIDFSLIPPVTTKIFSLGTEINEILAEFIENGKKTGVIKPDVQTMKTVYILWANISSLISLVQSKGAFIEKEFTTTEAEFLEYGYKQIINSILEERV
jgi:AcrR family transcriptional regulator